MRGYFLPRWISQSPDLPNEHMNGSEAAWILETVVKETEMAKVCGKTIFRQIMVEAGLGNILFPDQAKNVPSSIAHRLEKRRC